MREFLGQISEEEEDEKKPAFKDDLWSDSSEEDQICKPVAFA